MILRFRGRDGTFRINIEATQTFSDASRLLAQQLKGDPQLLFSSSPTKQPTGYEAMWEQSLGELGVKHGDLFFFEIVGASTGSASAGSEKGASSGSTGSANSSKIRPVDLRLAKKDGKIPRSRSKLCKHDDKGMCEYCIPLDPFNEQYRVDNGIKHLSLWAEIRKNGELVQPMYGVKPCKRHPPFPASICSACQPQPITLQQQKFRIVDHVEFADSSVINNFVDYWRQTNTQRIGFLIGEYKEYEVVPLGVKAVVHAIWEPKQSSALDGVALEESGVPANVASAAKVLGLEVVGVIWTDIVDAGNGDGSVLCKRHANSYFMSSQEVVFSANLQNQHPNYIQGAKDGVFSSKFVTCIISGNDQGQIDVACYQVSAAAESLVKSKLVEPSVNPSIVRVKKRTKTLFVPEVFYKQMNEHGNAVTKLGKPSFPTDYLLVSLSHGFSVQTEGSSARAQIVCEFPIGNRAHLIGQTPFKLAEQLELVGGFNSDKMQDFHLLAYLFSLSILSEQEHVLLQNLLELERSGGDQEKEKIMSTATQLAYSDGFGTLRMLAQ